MVYWSTNELYACDTQRMGLSGSQSGGHKSRSSDFLCAGMYRECSRLCGLGPRGERGSGSQTMTALSIIPKIN